jgi:uncharacterized protein (DUF608 family)
MRQCHCSGRCVPTAYTRREFLELVGLGAAGTLLAPTALGAFSLPSEEFARWKKTLFLPAQPRVYRSDLHTDARLHLGGIGTGNLELGADGQFTSWQLFNTLRDGEVPFHFAVRVGGVSRLLQTTGGPDWPRIRAIALSGEYPFATLRFSDEALPISLALTAFTPWAPLEVPLSSLPLAALCFRVRNPSRVAQTVSLAAFLQNPVGYDARGTARGGAHAAFAANVNEPLSTDRLTGLSFRALAGSAATLDRAVTLLAGANLRGLQTPPRDTPANLRLEFLEATLPSPDTLPAPAQTIVWLEDAPADLAEGLLRSVRDAVRAGATLVLAGKSQPLLRVYAAVTGGQPLTQVAPRPDIRFEDFEQGYEKWTVTGTAFGREPAHGTLPNQQRVSGFLGGGLVNSYLGGDDPTGRLTSKPFKLERNFIRFLVGGGHHERTQIRLLVNGKVVRAASGKDNERLEAATWEVREFAGQEAQLEILDEQPGGWGHINVDEIVFSDQVANPAVFELLVELLPARFSSVQSPAEPGVRGQVAFGGFALRAGAKELERAEPRRFFAQAVGAGQVVLADGALLDPTEAEYVPPRQRAYAVLCRLVGARYMPLAGQHPKAPGFGTLALGVVPPSSLPKTARRTRTRPRAIDVTLLPAFSDWTQAWHRFAAEGGFDLPAKAVLAPPSPSAAGSSPAGAVAARVTLPPGSSAEIPFLLAWHYPNKYNEAGIWMGAHYATPWSDAPAVARQAAGSLATLRARTEDFRRAFYDSTLPWWLLDCITANAAILRHAGVVFRIANGDVYGWEGSNGCCQPTCTHVWGYEQSLARLFPELERDLRRIDFKHQQRPDGGVNNRTEVPSPPRPTGEQPFADGHASCILKAYREALNSPDEGFLKEYWPHVRRAVDYLIGRDATAHGGEPRGYLEDDQWNTYDQALHGVTTFISGYYLAALRAGEEWARHLDEGATADRWRAVFERGRKQLVELCWNGEYFQQHLPGYEQRGGEVGPGCMADQLIGQWWAHQLGLGYILPQEQVRAALQAVFAYNFKSDLTGWKHAPRAFAGAKDKGLIICTWPKGGRPAHVMLYSDEVWTGIEYQVAAHLIYEGLLEEGLAMVKAARDRYDGVPRPPIPRNPWNEIECGGHYARALSSWSLLLALTGWLYDGPRQALRLQPRYTPANCKAFWSGPEGWGTLSQRRTGQDQLNEIHVAAGTLRLRELTVAVPTVPNAPRVRAAGRAVAASLSVKDAEARLVFGQPVCLRAAESLSVNL